jgi:pimeloyl-ACP methyl ester carboxylesterase
MKPIKRSIAVAVLTSALVLSVAACGTHGDEGSAQPTVASSTTTTSLTVERPTQLVDSLFDVDRGRLHLHCAGEGATTVLLIAGWDDGGDKSWSAVQPPLAKHSRVCTYDRFGTGRSDVPSTTQTFATEADDLHALLSTAGEPGPYVVVGHSFGGAEAVAFASHHRDEVVGLMLVDASPTTWPAALCAVPDDGTDTARGLQALCATFHDPTRDVERLDAFAAFDEVAAITSLGNLPMVVITAATRTIPGLAESQLMRLNTVWDAGVARWASLSTASHVVSVPDTGHYIQLEHPDVVIGALTKLMASAPQ